MHRTVVVLSAVLLGCAVAPKAKACSAVLMELGDRPVMARCYDWHIGNALLLINQPGMAKRALAFDNPAEWTSKYGSVTVNQYGRELPVDGINQAGLAIAVLWLNETEYPAVDERPSLSSAQWVQYQLDTAATVKEVIESDNAIRINSIVGVKVHFFVSDASGDCAVIEFIEGKMVVHHGDTLKYRQITNNTAAYSQEHIAAFEGFGGDQEIPENHKSIHRYARLAAAAKKAQDDTRVPHLAAFDTIRRVQHRSTRWQIVYDLEAKKMFLRTPGQPEDRTIDLAECKFDPASPAKVLDIDAEHKGNVVGEFRDYTREANRRLILKSVSSTNFTRNLPETLVNMVIEYPEHFCKPVAVEVVGGR